MSDPNPFQATIAYFQGIAAGTIQFGGAKTCPLCVAQGAKGCATCPIMLATGKPCSMQQIGAWSRHVNAVHGKSALPYTRPTPCATCDTMLADIVAWLQSLNSAPTTGT